MHIKFYKCSRYHCLFLLSLGLGKILAIRKILTPEILAAINKLIVSFSLPAIIFVAIASQPFKGLFDIPIIVSTISASILSFVLLLFAGSFLGLKGKLLGAFIPSGFWGNMAYMGFPLAVNAFGAEGLEKAAVVNGFTMPLYVFFGSVILSIFSSKQVEPPLKMVFRILTNPIVLSCFVGLIAGALLDVSGLREPHNQTPVMLIISQIIVKTLKLTGSMGLPLALISVGASLNLVTLSQHKYLIAISTVTKLVVTPLITFGIIYFFYPEAGKISLGAAVLLMTMPTAFIYTVVSQGLDVEGEFTASVVVVSTLFSIVAVPVWLYFLAV